tara:strand:- start:1790 stop:2035 length:246 start_codon:yes stop_codon:yes gene_type:complete
MKLSQLKNIIKEQLRQLNEAARTCVCDETHQVNNVPSNVTCSYACAIKFPDIEFLPQKQASPTPGGDTRDPGVKGQTEPRK